MGEEMERIARGKVGIGEILTVMIKGQTFFLDAGTEIVAQGGRKISANTMAMETRSTMRKLL